MQKGVGTLFVCLLCLGFVTPTSASGAASVDAALAASSVPAGARVLGRVIDPRTGAGISSVKVRLDTAAEAVTDADGNFSFSDVSVGSHRLTALLDGFSTSEPIAITVPIDGELRTDIEYMLQVTADVRGVAEPLNLVPTARLGMASYSGQQLGSTVGALDDVSRVMQLQPGATASEDDRNDVMVRGGGAYETGVLLDGFELPTASHFGFPGGQGGGLGMIPSAVIGRASLATSGFSVAYGETASAMMVIDTRQASQERLSGRVDVGAGGVMLMSEGRVPAGDGSGWLVSARRSILEVVFSRGKTAAVPKYIDVVAKADVKLSQRHALTFLTVGASDSVDVDWNSSAKTIKGTQDVFVSGVRLRSVWTPSTETLVTAIVSKNDETLAETDETATSYRQVTGDRNVRVRAEVRKKVGTRVEVMAGAMWKYARLRFDLQDNSHRNAFGLLVPVLRSAWTAEVSDAASYAEARFAPTESLRLLVGARAERSGLTEQWYGTPRARVEYRLSPRITFSTSGGLYRQNIPSIWLGSNRANSKLDPIRCLQWTGGIEVEPWRGGHLVVEGFAKRYTGYPIDPAEPSRVLISAGSDFDSPLVGALVASGRVHGNGVDVAASQRVARGFDVNLGYSYWNVSEYNLDGQWIPADFDIRHQVRFWTVWHPRERWNLSTLFRYASGRPYTPYDVAASTKAGGGRYDRTKNNALNMPPYHRLDVRAERLFVFKRTAITIFAEVDNLYDRDNVLSYEWSKTLKQGEPVYQWGITPVAGVRVAF